MPSLAPLQVVLIRNPDDLDVRAFEDAIARAFQGGKEAGGYLATGDDLGIQMEIFSNAPRLTPVRLADSFCHTLVVVFVDQQLLNQASNDLWDWLEGYSSHAHASNGRHAICVIAMDERVGQEFYAKRNGLARIQLQQTYQLGERAVRPAMFALRLIHECRILVASGLVNFDANAPHLRLLLVTPKSTACPSHTR